MKYINATLILSCVLEKFLHRKPTLRDNNLICIQIQTSRFLSSDLEEQNHFQRFFGFDWGENPLLDLKILEILVFCITGRFFALLSKQYMIFNSVKVLLTLSKTRESAAETFSLPCHNHTTSISSKGFVSNLR